MSPRSLAVSLFLLVACGGVAAHPVATTAPTEVVLPAPVPPSSSAPLVVASPLDESDAAVPISGRDPTWGSRTALVTIVEWSDFQCPFCQRVEVTLSALRRKYGSSDLRIVWKDYPLPFHVNARPAAIAGVGVRALGGNDAFWAFHDMAYANQADLGQPAYERWAHDAGVPDLDALRSGLASGRWADAVDTDVRDGKALGVQGTPAFFVNGVFLSGAQPIERFSELIEQELTKARARVESGTPRERVYADMARENRAHAPPPAVGDDDDDKEDTRTVFAIPVGKAPVRGNPDALVTIVEFGDFQCPFCARVQPTLDAVRAKYGDKVRLVWRNEPLPFHPRAEPAAEAALELRAENGDAAFWAMLDRLFTAQKDLSDDALVAVATSLGASAGKVRDAIARHTHKGVLDADGSVGEDFQASGTPHFFINGRRLVGAQPEPKFDAIIDEEVAKAQALVAKGTAPSGLYAALIAGGKGPTPPETRTLPPSMPVGDPARGSLGARVTLHEFADFQCPFCRRAEDTLGQLLKDYGGRVRFVWHDLPLPMHPDAQLAAEAAREAFAQKGPGAFWALHDTLFANQQALSRADLDRYARSAGLAMGTWGADLDGGAQTAKIEADKDVARGMGISGTPAFLVQMGSKREAYFISGAQPYATFKKVLDRALLEAR